MRLKSSSFEQLFTNAPFIDRIQQKLAVKEKELEEIKETHASKSNEEQLKLEEKLTDKLERLSLLAKQNASLESKVTSLESVISARDQQLDQLSSEKMRVDEELEKLNEEKSQLGTTYFPN